MNIKKPLIAPGALALVSLTGFGASAYAVTSSASSDGTSIIDKIASKFNLNKDEVKAVFDADRTEHMAERKAEQAERLATAVKDGDITQTQADYITKAQAEIEALRGDASPEDESDTIREQVKAKMDALRNWAEDNDVDMPLVGHGGGHGGFGGPGRDKSDS